MYMIAAIDTNATVQELLAQGREALAQQQSKRDEQEARIQAWKAQVFAEARAEAVKAFAPLDESLVEPREMPDSFRPNHGHEEAFFIRPFGASTITVKITGRESRDPDGDDGTWAWSRSIDYRNGHKQLFYVAHNFEAYTDGDRKSV